MTLKTLKPKSLLQLHAGGAGVILGLTAIAYFAVINPVLNTRAAAARHQTELDTQTLELKQAQRRIAPEQKRLSEARLQVAASPIKLDVPDQINRRVTDITELAAKCGVIVDTVTPGELTVVQNGGAVPINLTSNAGYRNIVRMLSLLREQMPDVTVANLVLDTNGSNDGTIIKLDLALLWHCKLPEKPAANPRR